MKTVAFVGNPNVGKSALINLLADSDLKVGNWSGVTTEKIEAEYKWRGETYRCIDLPGLYGFNQESDEERITEQYIKDNPIDCLVNVTDSTCLLNNLYCTLECREKQIPMILVLNFEDERIKNGIVIDTQRISNRLSLPIISMSALDRGKAVPLKLLIKKQCGQKIFYRPLWNNALDQQFAKWANQSGLDLKSVLEDFKNRHYNEMLECRKDAVKSFSDCVSKEEPQQLLFTCRLDKVLLHPIFGYPIALGIFLILFFIVFKGSVPLSGLIQFIFDWLNRILTRLCRNFPELLQALFLDGFMGALKTILSFVPILALLTMMMAILEESGYMARLALLADRFLRFFHLSGKAMISFVLGFGCNVPAVVSCGALENESMRRKTALLIPFASCGARLPIYVFFISLFFKDHPVLILFILYGTGVLAALALSLILDLGKKETGYFHPSLTELPVYRRPKLIVVAAKVKQECVSFLSRTFHLVLWVLLILWFLMNVPYGSAENSLLAQAAKGLSGLFVPLGFGRYWQLVASLFASFVAKETVVAFLLLLSPDLSFLSGIDRLTVLSFMLYCLCSVPCVMTCSALYAKYGWKHCLKSVAIMLAVPYLISFIVYQLFSFLQLYL